MGMALSALMLTTTLYLSQHYTNSMLLGWLSVAAVLLFVTLFELVHINHFISFSSFSFLHLVLVLVLRVLVVVTRETQRTSPFRIENIYLFRVSARYHGS